MLNNRAVYSRYKFTAWRTEDNLEKKMSAMKLYMYTLRKLTKLYFNNLNRLGEETGQDGKYLDMMSKPDYQVFFFPSIKQVDFGLTLLQIQQFHD